MARPHDRHPLGKCAEQRLEISMPVALKRRLTAVATIHGKAPTTWARDALEKVIEGEWAFMQRRVGSDGAQKQYQEQPEELPDE